MQIFFLLFYEFFKAGLFAIGGGLATLPFLYEMAEKYTWFDVEILSDMIAISESTPGPLGVNMATYAGYNCGHQAGGFLGGLLGALVATVGLILPSIIIIIIVAKFLKKIQVNNLVNDALDNLRPAVTALIAAACFSILQVALLNLPGFQASGNLLTLFNLPAILLFAVLFFAMRMWKKLHPIVFIAVAAVMGILLRL